MQAIINACKLNEISAEVAVVISDQPNAKGVEIAKQQGITTFTLDVKSFASKKEYEQDIVRILKGCSVDLVCLAGYMRVVGVDLLKAFQDKIINIHPSLLPSFKGLNAQKQALDCGVKYTGCTVHYVSSIIDSGPIIQQAVVEVKPADTVEQLSKRILIQEHRIYPLAIQYIIKTMLVKKGT